MAEAAQAEKKAEEKITIPYVDVRRGGPVELVNQRLPQLKTLLKGVRRQFGILTRVAYPVLYTVLDFFSGRWLKRNKNPYRDEITKMSKIIRQKGIVTQNVAYEWSCCTTGAIKTPNNEAPQLVRVMDWVIPDMGRHIVIAHQSGKAGDFYNVTWPGLSGVFNAVAKDRFAGAINQAPMRRRMLGGIVLDWVRNHINMLKSDALPPAHLLRKAFEEAKDYNEAKEMLTKTPVAMPVLFTLTGTKPGEGCVIERLENKAIVREMKDDRAFVTNHFQTNLNGVGDGWMPRGWDNHARAEAAQAIPAEDIEKPGYQWFKAPLANKYSVLAMVADAKTGEFHVTGVDGEKVVTNDFRMPGAKPESKPAPAITPPAP